MTPSATDAATDVDTAAGRAAAAARAVARSTVGERAGWLRAIADALDAADASVLTPAR